MSKFYVLDSIKNGDSVEFCFYGYDGNGNIITHNYKDIVAMNDNIELVLKTYSNEPIKHLLESGQIFNLDIV